MNNKYQNFKLGDFCKLKYGESLPERNRMPGAFPVYGSGGITGYHNKSLVTGPGIIIGRKGSVGTIYYEKNDFFPIDTVFYAQVDTEICDIKYLQYYLPTLALDSFNNDSAVPGLNREAAEMQKCNIPCKATQRKIASILSAYDDLIENNNRRIQILEEMAQRIYREWFVHFRFPGHENVKMVDSELGKIPEGWESKRMDELVGDSRNAIVDGPFGTQMKVSEYVDSGVPVVEMPYLEGGIITKHFENFVTESKYTQLKRSTALSGDIVMSKTGTLGLVGIIPDNVDRAIVVSRLARIQPSSDSPNRFFLFESLKAMTRVGYWNHISSGSTMPMLNLGHLKRLTLALPDRNSLALFEKLCGRFHSQIYSLKIKNQNLRKTRDLLLPRLISGRLDVEDLDIEV
tara:strand:- start:3240 stop:4445 length:1206 start_codon:yes stop_codon:yes gene_type:complete